jgi:hypothetical protein
MELFNREKLTRLRDFFRTAEPEGKFYMGDWACGTTMCIAGHAVALLGTEKDKEFIAEYGETTGSEFYDEELHPEHRGWFPSDRAIELLELNKDLASKLFYGEVSPCHAAAKEPNLAALAIDRVLSGDYVLQEELFDD